jgi:hypothetical protein
MSDEPGTLEDQLGEDDWAIIIGKDGNLKGLFMPEGSDEDMVPGSIVYIMENYFGIDFDEEMSDEESSDGQTIH